MGEARKCPKCSTVLRGKPQPRHFVVCGDCRTPEAWRLLSDATGGRLANVVMTSPPYASQRKYDEASEFRPIPPEEYSDWWEAVQRLVREHMAPDGSFFVNIKEHADGGERHLYVMDLVTAHKRKWGWMYVDEFCWRRAGVPGGWPNRFKNGWEPVFHFAAQPEIKFRPDAVSTETEHAFDYSPANGKSVSGSGLLGKEHAAGFREGLARPSNVIDVGSGGAKVSGEHPAEFPVRLPAFFVLAYSDPGDLVIDPFLGSGSTMVAAAAEGRFGAGFEVSPRYTDVIRRRMTRWLRAKGLAVGAGVLDDPHPSFEGKKPEAMPAQPRTVRQ